VIPRAAWALALAACTVAPGPVPARAPCQPSGSFFASNVTPRYLDRYMCGSDGCHAFADGHGYTRLRPVPLPAPTSDDVTTWPEAWRDNYHSVTQLVRCDAPDQSRLLTVPAGEADPHTVGAVVDDIPMATRLFEQWVAAP
jgi:hypothetical protein